MKMQTAAKTMPSASWPGCWEILSPTGQPISSIIETKGSIPA